MDSPSLAIVSGGGGGGTGGRCGLSITSVPAIPQRIPVVVAGVRSPSTSIFLHFSRNSCFHRLLVLHGNHRLPSRRLICGMSNSGKLVEEDEGSFALWISYLLTGAGANLVSWLVLPRNAVSIGASGAVFGLFAISVLVKMRWDWRKILEVLILGQFVLKKVMEEAQASARLPGTVFGGYSLYNINHIAHLSGALIGVILIWLLSGIPARPSTQDTPDLRRRADSA